MAKHNPGPWSIELGEVVASDNEHLGEIYRIGAWNSGAPITDSDQANAALIAAAPDLLEACKEMLKEIHEHTGKLNSLACKYQDAGPEAQAVIDEMDDKVRNGDFASACMMAEQAIEKAEPVR